MIVKYSYGIIVYGVGGLIKVNKLLTVTTPSYNRDYTLNRCYESLCSQTDQRFKWLIIDDGSTDATESIVKTWISEQKIDIIYVKKENGGKASALNVGLDILDTPYAVCLDSDDIFLDRTVELALKSLENVKDDKECCGILALRSNPDGTVMGNYEIPKKMKHVTAADIFLKLNLETELICFYKVDILKKFRFPEFKNERFVSPAWMQFQITQDYYYSTSWDALCVCEYVADGLTKNKRKVIVKNPKGYTCVKKLSFNYASSIKLIIKHGIMYDCGCLISHEENWLKDVRHRHWAMILLPVAYFVKIKRFGKLLQDLK